MSASVTPLVVAEQVAALNRAEVSVEYGRGPLADRRAKKVLGLPGPSSEICRAIKQAVELGLLAIVPTERFIEVYAGDRERRYPVVRLERL